jgi:hypothetical protein
VRCRQYRLHHPHTGAGRTRSFRGGHDLELFPGASSSSHSAGWTTARTST